MKQLTCELCGGTDLIKQEGVFVCQSCGCKYTLEEARKMMTGEGPEVVSTVKIDNSQQLESFLELSESAYNSGNGQSAFDFANKALEIMPRNSQAWICKMKSIEYLGTFGNLRLSEVIEAGKNAIHYAAQEEQVAITRLVYRYQLVRALELLKLSMNKMSDCEDIRRTYRQFSAISVFSASKNTMEADSSMVRLYDSIANEAVAMIKMVPDQVLLENRELAVLVGECAKQYQYVTNALNNRFAIYAATLVPAASQSRTVTKNALQKKSSDALRAIDQRLAAEKQAAAEERFLAYWKENAQLKAELLEEKKELDKQILQLREQLNAVPGTAQLNDLQGQINELTAQREALGMFKGKEKKALDTQIDQLKQQCNAVASQMQAERNAIGQKLQPLTDRVNAIGRELTMPR